MPRNLSRHEQFLRIYALLDILSSTRQPLDDQALIAQIKERLGLSRLSTRTLHRDCDFLLSCGYPVDHSPLPGDRKYGWRMAKDLPPGKRIPAEPVTLLELVALALARDLLRPFEGTVLWTGIESLRGKIEREVPTELQARLAAAQRVFCVEGADLSRYGSRPRLISTLSGAIVDCREIKVRERVDGEKGVNEHRLEPHQIVIRPPTVHLRAFVSGSAPGSAPVELDIERIDKVEPLDVTFVPRRG